MGKTSSWQGSAGNRAPADSPSLSLQTPCQCYESSWSYTRGAGGSSVLCTDVYDSQKQCWTNQTSTCSCSTTNTLLLTPIFINSTHVHVQVHTDIILHTPLAERPFRLGTHRYELHYNNHLAICIFKCCGSGFDYKFRITSQKMDCVI